MSENKKAGGDEPVQPEAKRKRTVVTQKQVLNSKQVKLLDGVTKGNSIAASGRRAGYNSRHAAHRGLQRAYASAPEVLLRLKITPDKIFRKLNKLMESAKREIPLTTNGIQMGAHMKVDAPDLQLKAAIELNKGFYGNQEKPAGDVNFNLTLNMGTASDDDIFSILTAAARTSGADSSGGESGVLQAEPVDMVAG